MDTEELKKHIDNVLSTIKEGLYDAIDRVQHIVDDLQPPKKDSDAKADDVGD